MPPTSGPDPILALGPAPSILFQRLVPPPRPLLWSSPSRALRLCQGPASPLALLPKACLGHFLKSWLRPSSPGPAPRFPAALAPPLGRFFTVITPLFFPKTRFWSPPHSWPLPRTSSTPLHLSPAPPTLAPTGSCPPPLPVSAAMYPTAAITPVAHSVPQPPPLLQQQQREGEGAVTSPGRQPRPLTAPSTSKTRAWLGLWDPET